MSASVTINGGRTAPSYARKDIVAEGEIGIYHCVNRCVRRAWLCGKDPLTQRSYDHGKQWIRGRLEELAATFGLDVLGFAVMSNHFHVVQRSAAEFGIRAGTPSLVPQRVVMLVE
jgi:hypothetical protein